MKIHSNDVNLLQTHYLISADSLISIDNREEKTTHLLTVTTKSLDTIKTRFPIEYKTKGENYEKMRVFSKLRNSAECTSFNPVSFAACSCCCTYCCCCSCCC